MVHPPRACADRVVRPATSRSHISTRCSPRSPKAPRIRGYSTGGDCGQRFGAYPGLGVRIRQVGQGMGEGLDIEIEGAACVGSSARAVCWTPAIPAARSGCCRESSPLSPSRHPSPEMIPAPAADAPDHRAAGANGRAHPVGGRASTADDRRHSEALRHRLHLTSRARRSRARSCSPVCTPTALLVSMSPSRRETIRSGRCDCSVRPSRALIVVFRSLVASGWSAGR